MPDIINGVFEFLGGFMVILNIRRLLSDKLVRGVDWRVFAFFTAWGFWNLFYYPHLGQWFSFIAGAFLATANIIQFTLMIYYIRKEKHHG